MAGSYTPILDGGTDGHGATTGQGVATRIAEDQMTRGAFGYIRVSGPTQAKDDRDGFPRQKQVIREWAKANNVRIIKIFKDVLPGKTPLEERPGMQAMLGALLADGIKLVVIEKLDRLSRKL